MKRRALFHLFYQPPQGESEVYLGSAWDLDTVLLAADSTTVELTYVTVELRTTTHPLITRGDYQISASIIEHDVVNCRTCGALTVANPSTNNMCSTCTRVFGKAV